MNILNKNYLKFNACLFCVLSFFYQTIYASEFIYHLTSEQWAVPRSASSILSMEALTSTMQAIQVNDNSSLVIHHPGGDEGSLWALELRGWLISLGLPATKISLSPGSTDTRQLDLEIIIDRESAFITEK